MIEHLFSLLQEAILEQILVFYLSVYCILTIMSNVIFFFSELFLLFLLSRTVTKKLSRFLYHQTRSQKITITGIALLFFPGTFIHELSHYLMAQFLFVPVGHMEFVPKIEGTSVKLGSVSIARTDIFRRLLIGMAPFLFGTTIILILLFYAAHNNLFDNPLFILLIGYVLFEIGNTMFSSKKDMEGAIELLLTLGVIGTIFYFVGLRLPEIAIASIFEQPLVAKAFEKGSLFLLAPLGIDILIIGLFKLFKH